MEIWAMVLLVSLGPLLASDNSKDTMVNETRDLEMVEGDNATIECCFRSNNGKHKVNWNKNEILLHANTAFSQNPANNLTCANLTLTNVTHNHTGRYACKVNTEIPTLQQFTGNGTQITVTERQSPTNATAQTNSTKESPFPLGTVVSLATVMPAAFFIALICFWKQQKRQELDRAARVIYEDPRADSEVDGASTSSSKGSSQWCQVPVYESFNYFEPGEIKGSG